MGWRKRFDPAQLRVDKLRERARQLGDPQAIRQQAAQIGRVGFRGEVLVPIAALLILTVALVLSVLSSEPSDSVALTPTISDDVAAVITGTTTATVTTTPLAGYPAPSESATASGFAPEPSDTVSPDDTSVPALDDTTIALLPSGYPAPDLGPQPVDPAPGGELPVVPPPVSDFPAFPTTAPAPIQPPPPLLNPTPRAQAPQPTFADDSAYPPPDTGPTSSGGQITPSNPQPTLVGTPETDTPAANGTPVSATPQTSVPAETPTPAATSTPAATPVPPTPTARPGKVLTGNLRWTVANSPVVLTEDHALAAGATLTIDPGVEVRIGPNIQFTIGGTLQAQGSPAAPVRFVGAQGRWDGLAGTPGSSITLDGVQIRQAGRTGTAVSSTGGTLVIRNSSLEDSGGGIVAIQSAVDLRSNQITGNAIAGPVVNIQAAPRAATTLIGNRIGGNGSPAGAPQVLIAANEAAGRLTIEGNLLFGSPGIAPAMILSTKAPLAGTIRCNGFTGGTIGLQLNAGLPDASGFSLAIDNNAFTGQTTYGATSTVGIAATNNWWADPSGPSDTQRNASGRGVPVGVNIEFQPWLAGYPACAPAQ